MVASEAPAGAPRVVVVHGAMDRSTSFGRVARQLDDLEVVRYDRRGYGRSIDLGPGDLDDDVADLVEVLDGRPSVVFGHSIGGVVALVAAVRRPDLIRSVLAYEAPAPWAPWWPARPGDGAADPADEAEAFMRRAIGDHLWGRLGSRTRAARRAEGPALQADMASLEGAEPFDPASVAIPVVVGSGSETSWWHARAARELAEALPHAVHRVVAGAGHGAHLTHPAATAALIREAVDRASAPGRGR